MRVLVTGGSGFLGVPLLQTLTDRGHCVLALTRDSSYQALTQPVTWLLGDLNRPETYRDEIRKFRPEACIHLAWEGIPEFTLDNALKNIQSSIMFLSFLSSLESCQRVIVSGTCAEYGKDFGECVEHEKGKVQNSFSWAKTTILSWADYEFRRTGKRLAWFRVFFAYGPNQRSGALIPSLIQQLKAGEKPKIVMPFNRNDFVFNVDIVEALHKALEVDFVSGIYNLGSGSVTQVIEVLRIVEQRLMGSDQMYRLIRNTAREDASYSNYWASNKKVAAQFGWNARTSLEVGISKIVSAQI